MQTNIDAWNIIIDVIWSLGSASCSSLFHTLFIATNSTHASLVIHISEQERYAGLTPRTDLFASLLTSLLTLLT